MSALIEITPGKNTLEDWRRIYTRRAIPRLGAAAKLAIESSAAHVNAMIAAGRPVYGVNTGFGRLANQRIDDKDLAQLQLNLVLSHTVGVGDAIADDIVRMIMAMKLAALAHGVSGVSLTLAQQIETMLERELIPVIPAQGSVGASGDLAPLAHLSAVMIGHGQARYRGEILSGGEALRRAGMEPITLGPKEGLALLNGTQVSTAFALAGLFEAELVFRTALVCGALSTEAGMGSTVPFDSRIQALKPHRGQKEVAAVLRNFLLEGDFRAEHVRTGRLQDPYCLRCQPQVMGACLDVMRCAAQTLEIEGACASDNPLILGNGEEVVSGGNFHAEPVAFAADMMANAIAEIGGMSERRIAFLIDSSMSGLPPFLTGDPGLSSGFMSAQIVAAALVSENRQKSHPASVDSVPTVGNQEDFVSMATQGARRLLDMSRNASHIVAIELLAAVEGMDHRKPFRSSEPLEAVRSKVRERVPSMAKDREFSEAINAASDLVRSGAILSCVGLERFPHTLVRG